MQTFTDTEQAKLRAAFDTLVWNVGPAPELDELADRPLHVQPASGRQGRHLVAAAVVTALLLGIGLTALLTSGDSDSVADASARGDVIVFLPSDTPLGTLIDIADEVLTWDGVAIASPWTSEDALDEFEGMFADQPDLIAVVREDPSILPASVRIWVDAGVDPSQIAQRARKEYPEHLDISYEGEEQPDASDIPDSTLPPLEVLATQVEPIRGYGDYSGYSYSAVPWEAVTAAEIACMQDQGWPVRPDGDTGISFRDVPIEDNQAVQIDFARCMAGLNLPEYDGPTG